MMNTKGLFAVSLIAMLAMGTANADIASKNYVDVQVDGRLSSISGSTSGTGNVVTSVSASGSTVSATKGITAEETKNKVTTVRATASATDTAYPSEKAVATALAGKADSADIPTVNNATLTIQKNGSNVGTFTANAASPATINITVPTTTSQLTNNSGFITADDLPEGYVLTAATSDKLGGVKSGGDITVGTDGIVTVNSAASADTATTATSATNATNATNATKATQDASGNVITTTYATKTELGTVESAVETAQSTANSAASVASAAQSAANTKVAKAQGSTNANKVLITDGSGNVMTGTVSSAMITDGTITNADISSSAAIAQSKISGLTTSLNAKANTADLAEVATSGSYNDLTDKPSIPAAITVDSALSSTSTNPVQNKVINSALAGKLSTSGTAAKATADANGNNIVNTYATKSQITALDSTSSGTGAVVTAVSQADGKVSVTKGNVKIPIGSENATTYATIWVE